jgi:cyclophilin family peptidyl-prolyl cis-trans isomerase
MRLLVIGALAGALMVTAACGGGTDNAASNAGTTAPTRATTPAAKTPTAATSPAAQTMQTGGKKTYSAPPPMTIDPNKKYTATIKMDIGDIAIELYPKDAPETVNSFVFLARDHFYDGVTFHRVIPGFVAQAGDPTGTGRGGPGYTVKDEVNSRKFLEGSVGMAKTAAPNSAGSQWFIDYTPQPSLDGKYTVFGQLVSGRDVLDKITPRDPATSTQPGTAIKTIEITEQ